MMIDAEPMSPLAADLAIGIEKHFRA